MPSSIRLSVKRQDTPTSSPYWEDYEIPYQPRQNVVSVLMEMAKDPKTREGKPTSPVVYDRACLEEVCGSCAMRINGVSRMACTALIDSLEQPIRLEPMAKFPVQRDLAVDRQVMFESLKRVKAWIPIDGTYDLGPGPRMPEAERQLAYEYSKCITCGNCLDVCPQVNDRSNFIGAAAIAQARLFNSHPTGGDERRRASRGSDGRGRHRRLRQRAELRPGVPEVDPADDGDRGDVSGHDPVRDQEALRDLRLRRSLCDRQPRERFA